MITSDNPRDNALRQVLAEIEKAHGKGAVMQYGSGQQDPIPTTPTGSIGLDRALGCGGYPRGRIVEVFGPEASGKTTLTLHAMAEMQAAGGRCAFIDAEHALDPIYAQNLGVRLDQLIVSQPDDGEQALDIVEALARSCAIDLIVVDSVAALVPKDELEGSMSDLQVGLQARMMSKAMRKLTAAASRSSAALIFINQVRQKIGQGFGPSEVTTGGNALKYYASVRLDVRRVGPVKKGDEVVGNRTRVKVVKNKLAPPFRVVEFDILYGRGVHRAAEVFDLAEARGLLTRNGSWYALGEQRLGQGRDNVIELLEKDPTLFERVAQSSRGAEIPFAAEA